MVVQKTKEKRNKVIHCGGNLFRTAALLLLLAPAALARQERILGSRYTSARIAGMGDSGLVMAEDVMSGLFYNPAVLPRFQKFVAEPLNVSLYLNHDLVTGMGLDSYNIFSLPTYAKSTFQGLGGAAAAAVGYKFIFAGLLFSSELGGVRNGDGTFRYRTTYQLIPSIGTGISLADGVLRLGYSLQWVNSVNGGATAAAAGANYNTGLAQGSGFSQTLAASLTLPMSTLPQIHAVLRNFLGTTYMPFSILPLASGASGVPTTDPMSLDLAIGIKPKFGMGSGFNISAGWRDVWDASATPFLAHLNFGLELQVKNFLFFRGGLSSGYPSAGFGVKSKRVEFNAAWYSEELGGYLQYRDMRYLVQFQLRLP